MTTKYKISDLDIIKNNSGWQYHPETIEDRERYTHILPVYTWNRVPTILGRITVYTDNKNVTLDCYYPNGNPVTAFYVSDYFGNYDTLLAKISNRFNQECNKYGIKKYPR